MADESRTAPLLAGERFIREDECRIITGLSRSTRWRLERQKKFPARQQISDNAVGWWLPKVRVWKESPSTYREEVGNANAA